MDRATAKQHYLWDDAILSEHDHGLPFAEPDVADLPKLTVEHIMAVSQKSPEQFVAEGALEMNPPPSPTSESRSRIRAASSLLAARFAVGAMMLFHPGLGGSFEREYGGARVENIETAGWFSRRTPFDR